MQHTESSSLVLLRHGESEWNARLLPYWFGKIVPGLRAGQYLGPVIAAPR